MQRHYKIRVNKTFTFFVFSYYLLIGGVNGQNADINLLKKISTSKNSKYENFQSGLSFSVYPALVLTPSSFVAIGLLNKDTNQINTGVCIATGIALNTGALSRIFSSH